jgi:hypothetical protein
MVLPGCQWRVREAGDILRMETTMLKPQHMITRIGQFLLTRRATRQLGDAIACGNMEDMRVALERGANPNKAERDFEEPAMHFQELYQVTGALELAIHQDLPLEAFELLIRHGGGRGRQSTTATTTETAGH